MLTPTQILRADRLGQPSVRYAFFSCFFISAISAFMVLISSASFSSHSSRVLAYTFLDMRLPLTLGVNRPSYRWSFIIVTQPVPLFLIFGLYGSKTASVAFSSLGSSHNLHLDGFGHFGVCTADFSVDANCCLLLHGVCDMAVDVQGRFRTDVTYHRRQRFNIHAIL